jgi:predicted acylesterase/phospholipase RssA
MSCIRVPAYLSEWQEAGLVTAVDHIITVSGSGGGVGAFLSGLPHRAIQVFEALAVTGFVSTGNYLAPSLRLSQLAKALRGEHSPIAFDQSRITASRTSWHVVATRITGTGTLIDAKTAAPDAVQAVLASSAFPGLTEPVPLLMDDRHEHWIDGCCTMPLPISTGIKQFRPDTVIVLESCPPATLQPWLERCVSQCLFSLMNRRLPEPIRRGLASMDRLVALEAYGLSRRKRIRWCRITPTRESVPVGPLTSDIAALRRAAIEARRFMSVQLQQAAPARQI